MMIGMSRYRPSLRIAAASSAPSMTGIIMSVSTRSTLPSLRISRASRPLIARVTWNPDSRSISRNISARPNSSSTIKIDCVEATTLVPDLVPAWFGGHPAPCRHARFTGKRVEQAESVVGDAELAHPGIVIVVADLQDGEHPQHRGAMLDVTQQDDVLCGGGESGDGHFDGAGEQLARLGGVERRDAEPFELLRDGTVDVGHPFRKIGGPFESLHAIE